MTWVEGKPDHLLTLSPSPAQQVSQGTMRDVSEDPELVRILPFYARTLLDGGVPVAMIGAWPVDDGIARAWAVLSKDALASGIRVVRGAHRFLAALAERDGLRRLEATVDPQHEAALIWLHKLGFVREGLMECYEPDGRASFLYARTRF